jgi:hypothetical protein
MRSYEKPSGWWISIPCRGVKRPAGFIFPEIFSDRETKTGEADAE